MRRQPKAATYAAERASLAARMHGPDTHTTEAQQAVAGDEALSNRLSLALGQGMVAPDLTSTSLHRQADTVECALEEWEKQTAGGPCAFCGSVKRRRGAYVLGPVSVDDLPGFTTRDGHPACGWCNDILREHGEPTLRVRVFLAAAGCTRTGGLWQPPGALFAHEVSPSLSDGTPWSHTDRAQARAVAKERLHRSCFATTPGAADRVSMPGLLPHIWSAESLPRPEPKIFNHVSPKSENLAKDWEDMKKRTAVDRQRQQNRREQWAADATRSAAARARA